MWRDDHLPQPATEASRAVWAGVMNREVRERWRRQPFVEAMREELRKSLQRSYAEEVMRLYHTVARCGPTVAASPFAAAWDAEWTQMLARETQRLGRSTMSDGSHDPVTHTHPCRRCGQPFDCASGFEQDGRRGWCRAYSLGQQDECETCAATTWCSWCGEVEAVRDNLCLGCEHDGAVDVETRHAKGLVDINTADGTALVLTAREALRLASKLFEVLR